MNALATAAILLAAGLSGPHITPPSFRATVIVGSDQHSRTLQAEWDRTDLRWPLWKLRAEAECYAGVRFVDHARYSGTLTHLPAIVLGDQTIPLTRCGGSGEALRELRGILTGYGGEREFKLRAADTYDEHRLMGHEYRWWEWETDNLPNSDLPDSE